MLVLVIILFSSSTSTLASDTYQVPPSMLNFMVYFKSYTRAICSGFLVSYTTVMTATICVQNPEVRKPYIQDVRPITVIVGTKYRHPRRGIRVQVRKIVLLKRPDPVALWPLYFETTVALLVLNKRIPDTLTEFPLKPIAVDWKGDFKLTSHTECITAGWHFMAREDAVELHSGKFRLYRNQKSQLVEIAKTENHCSILLKKFERLLKKHNYETEYDLDNLICTKDGMYGSPLICGGVVVAVLTAPDMQWYNCTGFTNMWTRLKNTNMADFFRCVSDTYFAEDALVLDRTTSDLLAEYAISRTLTPRNTTNYEDFLPPRIILQPNEDESSQEWE